MGKFGKKLADRAKNVSHTEKGRKPRKESALDKCAPVRECDRDTRELVSDTAQGSREAYAKVATELETLETIITSDDYYNAVMMTAPDSDTAEAIIKNCRTRLHEFANFVQYVNRIDGKFVHADVIGDVE